MSIRRAQSTYWDRRRILKKPDFASDQPFERMTDVVTGRLVRTGDHSWRFDDDSRTHTDEIWKLLW